MEARIDMEQNQDEAKKKQQLSYMALSLIMLILFEDLFAYSPATKFINIMAYTTLLYMVHQLILKEA
ncbi:MAG: hypothetical protein ACI35R_14420 [Bacillus sp. (in: firmicutes)]